MVHLLVLAGIAVSLGLIAVSAMLNFRMGYRGADTELDGLIYGIGAGCGDVLKAIAPFVIFWGMKHRDWLAVGASAGLFLIFSGYSITAALGFAAQHRAHKDGENLGVIEKRGDLRRQLGRVDARLDELGTQRSALEIAEAIAGVLHRPVPGNGRTVSEQSKQCTLNRKSTRDACAEIGRLREELARAQEAERLTDEAREVRKQLDATNAGAAVTMADPQVEALARTAAVTKLSVDKKDVEFGLAWLLALFVEAGSGLGLYVATTPWRNRDRVESAAKGRGDSHGKDQGLKLGPVDTYALERLEPRVDGEVRLAEMYMDYQVWCRWRGDVPFNRDAFGNQFKELAAAAGIRSVVRSRAEIYLDVRFAGRG